MGVALDGLKYGGNLSIHLRLVPSLLKIVGAVGFATIGIAEGDISDVVAGQRRTFVIGGERRES